MAHRIRKTALAALSFELTAGAGEIQLLPDGLFRAADGSGRPEEVDAWRIDADIARQLLARMAAKPNKIVIDYEHQTLHKEANGQPAPAAGWFVGSGLEYRPGAGIFATDPQWTKRAAGLIADDEYKYISPVISYDTATGAVLDIRMVALSNFVGIAGMSEVALTALCGDPNDFSTEEVPHMLKKLLAAIGLADTASEAEALGAVAALTAKANSVAGLEEKVTALTAKNPDPTKFAPVAAMQELQTQVAALTASICAAQVEKIVGDAIDAGKLLPAQKDWALDLGKSNLAALTGYVEKTPAIAALNGLQTEGKTPDGVNQRDAALTATDETVMAQFGLSKDEYVANR